jgi:hypothetical protein
MRVAMPAASTRGERLQRFFRVLAVNADAAFDCDRHAHPGAHVATDVFSQYWTDRAIRHPRHFLELPRLGPIWQRLKRRFVTFACWRTRTPIRNQGKQQGGRRIIHGVAILSCCHDTPLSERVSGRSRPRGAAQKTFVLRSPHGVECKYSAIYRMGADCGDDALHSRHGRPQSRILPVDRRPDPDASGLIMALQYTKLLLRYAAIRASERPLNAKRCGSGDLRTSIATRCGMQIQM